ncbi:MAG: tetratricopeptide repeat protein [Chloroflexi bacterium]|nr:tetratricopeptide repeat protein [Chloroflexota bacterium]
MALNSTASLVVAKTHRPPRRADLLRRPRLIDFLYAHIEKQLCLITAPAGYGKTSLLIDFAHDADFPVAWYALDEFDNTPHTFLQYLLASIRVHFPTFGSQALMALDRAADSLESLQSVVALIANDLFRLPDHLVIIFDDYHAIHNPTIHDLVALLIRYGAESCHLILDSRTLPKIPDQILLLARGQMDGLSINELKFTAPEIQALVQQNFKLAVPEERAQELAQVTDGWITALLLMAHQMGWRELVEGAALAPDAAGRVYEYLAEQVFAKQPPEIQRFMIGSSILDPLDPDLLNRLPGVEHARQHLDILQSQQLFVTRLGGTTEAYTYHPLFREFLKTRLRYEDPAWFETLALTCAKLFEEQGQWERVVEIHLSLGRTEDAVRALESAEDSLRTPSHIAVMSPWLEALPAQTSDLRPHLQSLKGKIHRSRGELEQALFFFDSAARLFEQMGDPISAADKIELKGAVLALLGRYRECIEHADKIDALVGSLSHSQAMRLKAASLHLRGTSEYSLGDLANAFAHLKNASEMFGATEDLIGQANVYHDLGITTRAQGLLSEALSYYSAALRLWEQLQNPGSAASTLNSLGNVYYLQGETREADKILRDALVRAREEGTRRIEALVLATLGDLYRDLGDYPQALEFYADSLRAAQEAHRAYIVFYSKLGTSDCYRLMGDLRRAREWLDSAAQHVQTNESALEVGQFKLCRGLLAQEQAQLDEAIVLFGEASALFHASGNKHLEAQTEFNLAHALNIQGKVELAQKHLMPVARLVDELGYDNFLVVDGRRTELTLRMASTMRQVGARFKQILERIRPVPSQTFVYVTATQATPALSVYTLGQERFTFNGVEVSQLRPQARELFLFLLTRYPQGARRDELWELFWPDSSAERADGALRITATRIRKALCPVVLANGWYALAPEQLWYDTYEFEKGLTDANRAQGERAKIARLEQALELYRGDYLERVEGDWVIVERERLKKIYLAALISLGETYNQVGDLDAALQTYNRASRSEPFFEAAWRGGMQTHVRMGNRAAALAHYEKLKTMLQEEMGVEPSPEVQRFYRRIVQMTV